ncbi:MAG: hypothetical protein A2046_00025 [Bacteroidetes bacterium GWA2_30_7]|nr:MAG: hypothetical protein A2046_00025 [Bacteroidetes bacterium GWA2_30_7]
MGKPEIYQSLRTFAVADNKKSIIQLTNTLLPYFTIMAIMYWLLKNEYPYWIVILLAIINAGFMARTFIIFHDCTHGSFFKSRKLCKVIGYFCGIIVFTPFSDWQYSHKIHHATTSNLDKRGVGDLWMMTVNEYNSSSKFKKFIYRLYRNPIFLFIIIPAIKFILVQRIPNSFRRNKKLCSHIITTSAIIIIIFVAWLTIGLKNYILIQLPIMIIGGGTGIFLFYIQHQFKGSYWSRDKEWDPFKASMDGASFYNLPILLRWFTGNIGFHHIHHLHPGIPNYKLKKCNDEISVLQNAHELTLVESFRCSFLKLYDEGSNKMVTFKQAKEAAKTMTS